MEKKHFFLGNEKKSLLGSKNEENHYDYDENTFVFDPNRKNDSHITVVNEIKEQSIVLDIGCASGIIGNLLTKYKKCIVDGIEYDKKAYEITKNKKIYRNVYNCSILEPDSKEFQKLSKNNNTYDYIIFADVLEHLVEPWQALINVSKFLKKNGYIIVSIPNISHIDIIKGLINNEFNYAELGILDKTHLRFFTPSSFKDMIDNIADVYNVYFNVEMCGDMIIKPEYFNENDIALFNMNNNIKKYLALQNIYKLQIVDKKEDRKSNIKNKSINNFDNMIKQYQNLVNENKNNKNALKKTIEEKEKFEQELYIYKKELNKILNSKRWKMINKLFKIMGK